jgi:flagellar basal body rod protein FlgG
MIYGMYLSATGVMTSSHRQDVIANNLANVETNGFKRAMAQFEQRPVESAAMGRPDLSNPMLDAIGGGIFVSPTRVDNSQGTLQPSDSPLHVALYGDGYFAVRDGEQLRLTRNGNFMLDRSGTLVMSNEAGTRVLDEKKEPIKIDVTRLRELSIGKDGTIALNGEFVAKLGVFDVADRKSLVPAGGALLTPQDATLKLAENASVESGYLEGANVDPAIELTQLILAQRQLEANANMLRFQDQTLGRLVNDVGKIG